MDVIPLGHSAFKLKGKLATVICDPYDPEMTGLKLPKNHLKAHIVTVSHQHPDHNYTKPVEPEDEESEVLIFSEPGEYEVRGVEVTGIGTFHDNSEGSERGTNTVFRITVDGIHIVHCGDLGHQLTEAQLEQIGNCDILLIPVGGHFTIGPTDAVKVVNALEPGIVLPMHYKRTGLNEKNFAPLVEVGEFLKEIGKEAVVAQPKLSISKDKLPEETQVIVLE
ncbi:TPA: hypothetical protein DIV55_06325 [Patescibacteria group bacterium]|uniref:Zn-dependent hydrolase of the beta-lactamase fold-like protein n=1 Tax=Candidatus Gottesmanbacteria bacterium GW2011_GWA1_43_11 TaxID=1618436 RepID=A0A0G1CIM3_9BACT|nr:MAG: Zn-dependent hydrolase of the beta-lactamase fold-like protein [Candidatus Gottesmanbacteria bacterium GW2011_GWA1_43_11]HCS79323.1 hypothetical protein [Patescibacteria group bacterium]